MAFDYAVPTSILEAISDVACHWSLVKLPAQVALVAQALPNAIALTSIRRQTDQLNAQYQEWLQRGLTLFNVWIGGFSLLVAQRLDSYAFAQLTVAILFQPTLLMPAWLSSAGEFVQLVLQATMGIASPFTFFRSIRLRIPRLSSTNRYIARLKTSRHLQATALVFLVDAVSQLPKRWSFPAQASWKWAGAVLMVQAGMLLIERRGGDAELVTEGLDYSEVATQPVANSLRNEQQETIINAALQHCITSLSALLLAPHLLTSTGQEGVSNANAATKHMCSIVVAWTILWFILRRTDASPHPSVEPQTGQVERESEAGTGSRWWGKVIMVIAMGPAMLAVLKHGLTGNTLTSIFKYIEHLVSGARMCLRMLSLTGNLPMSPFSARPS